jgi:Amt family ammonium transporter
MLDTLGQTQLALNFVWTLLAAFLVMFMQTGFAMIETGFCRAKNAVHVAMTNLLIYPVASLGFWLCGFAFMFGGIGGSVSEPVHLGSLALLSNELPSIKHIGLIGWSGFCLSSSVDHPSVFALFLFHVVFLDTMATIPTGAMAERWRFSVFLVYGLFASIIIYPIYGNWVWGGGWLATLGQSFGLGHGAVDFAGSGVVHAIGGFTALAGVRALGPRLGRFTDGAFADSTVDRAQFKPHNVPLAILGTFILAFGWFGFNAGSTLGVVGAGNLRISLIAVNTLLASASGATAALVYMKFCSRYQSFEPSMSANGMLAGLVAITASCAFVGTWAAVVIGAVAGFLVCKSHFFLETHFRVDDPVGAISVHGTCGLWGVIALGIFANGTYGEEWNGIAGPVKGVILGDLGQLGAQLMSSAVCAAWAFGVASALFWVQKKLMGGELRPTRAVEKKGLDDPEMGITAYGH